LYSDTCAEFLGGHTGIARDLSKDASLVKKNEYMHSHPELQAYLSAQKFENNS
jgi:hypothetical protein